MDFGSTDKGAYATETCCVVYDRSDGSIRHVHRAVTLNGAEPPNEDEIRKAALSLADAPEGNLGALMVEATALEPGKHYRVDELKGGLVDIDGERPAAD